MSLTVSTHPLDRLLRLISILGHKVGIYGWWHRVRREDPRGYMRLPVLDTVEDIEEATTDRERTVWTRDRPRILWDLISHPGRWWTRFVQTRPNGMWVPPSKMSSAYAGVAYSAPEDIELVTVDNDCDEAATCMIALLRLLSMSGKPGARRLGSHSPVLLQVVWRTEDGVMKGHHLCAYSKRLSEGGPVYWFHGGNWGPGGSIAVDNPGDPLGSGALRKLASNVVARGGGGAIIHAHACMKPENLSRWIHVA